MISQNQKQQKIKLLCKKHDSKKVIMWCRQPDCKEERLCCVLCNQESKHISHLKNVFEIDSLFTFFDDQQKKRLELKQLVQDSSEEFNKFICQMMDGIECKFYRFDPENKKSHESICEAIQFSHQFENLKLNIKEQFLKKLKQTKEQLGQFNKDNQIDIEDEEDYCKLGDSLFKQNRLDEAKTFYQKSLNFTKNDLETKIRIAQCLQKSHNYKEALELYKDIQNYDKDNYLISVQIAECLRNMWQNEEAFAAYSEALKIKKSITGFFMQCIILINMDRKYDIHEHYQKAKELGVKNDLMKLFKTIKLLIDSKIDEAKAKQIIEKIEKDSDEQIDFWKCYLNMLVSDQNQEESLKYANQILKIEPNNIHAVSIKLKILVEQNQYEEVIIMFDKIRKINEKHEFILNFKEKLYSQLQELDYEEQMATYELILQFHPKNVTTLILQCQCLINENKLKLALFTLEKILKVDSNEEILELKNMLQKKFYAEIPNNQINDFFSKWLKMNPSNTIVLELMYFHLIEQEDFGEAEKIIKQSLEYEPNNYQHQFNLCKCLIQLDKIKEAIKLLNIMIEIHSPTEEIIKQNKELFDQILSICEQNDNGEIINKLLKKNPNNFVAKIVECFQILQNDEEEFEKRVQLFKHIDDILDQQQDKQQQILNFLDNQEEESIREIFIILKAIKELSLITKNKQQNSLINYTKDRLLQIIQKKLDDNQQKSLFSYIVKAYPDNLVALEFKTRYFIENKKNNNQEFQQSEQEQTNEVLENIETIFNQNPNAYTLIEFKCEYLLQQDKFREAIELVNQIFLTKNQLLICNFSRKNQNSLTTLIEMIQHHINTKFDQEYKLTELIKILQANQDNQIALLQKCTLLQEEEDLQRNALKITELIKVLHRLRGVAQVLSQDIIKKIIDKFENVQDVDEIINTFTKLELNNSEKLLAKSILCKILIQNDKYQEAQHIVNQMLSIDPKNISALEFQTICLFQQGNVIESYILLDQIINQFQGLDEIAEIFLFSEIMDFVIPKLKDDENQIEHLKEIKKRNPLSMALLFCSDTNEDEDAMLEILKNNQKLNPNNQFYQTMLISYMIAGQKYKELILSNIKFGSFIMMLIFESFSKIKNKIEEDIDNVNVIEYFDQLSPNGSPNRLFDIIKGRIVIEKGNQQESIEQLQKILSIDEKNVLDDQYHELFKTFSNRFLESENKIVMETIIKKNLENDPQNLVFWFLNTCVKLEVKCYY